MFWQEYAVTLFKDDEQKFVEQASRLAKEQGIYLVMALGVFPLEYPERPWVNKLIWLGPGGSVILEYIKSKPAPPLEPITPGPGTVAVVETPYGKIAAILCADQDYPHLVRQAGKRGAGLLLIPSQDWPAVTPLHTQMAAFRAIENGLAVVKTTGEGLSAAFDARGRTLATLDCRNTQENTMFVSVPVKHFATFYGLIGDLFAWLCLAALFVFTGKRLAGRKRGGSGP